MEHRPNGQVLTVIAIALTFASGAMDVASFTRLGSVFTSVMTGNIVLWGLAAARGSLTLASHTAVAIVGYIAGVAGGSRIAVGIPVAGGRGAANGTGREDAGGKDAGGKDGDERASGARAGEGRTGEGQASGARAGDARAGEGRA